MNSHDAGVNYALMGEVARREVQQRANWIADVTDAMQQGFKAEPDLAPHHLPLLSLDALERVFKESEKWRDKWRERDLEKRLALMTEAEKCTSDNYVALREIIGALDVPHYFNPKPVEGKGRHILWTEQKARGLVGMAEDSEKHAEAAKDAERRVDLLERYVRACDEKRVPYNWNVFKMPTRGLQQLVNEHEARERLTRCDTDPERVAHFAERVHQETEQSLRWHAQRADQTRQLIEHHNGIGIDCTVADELLDALLDRKPQDGNEWIVWQRFDKDRRPPLLNDDDMVEIETVGGGHNTLQVSVVAWEQVKRFRRVK